MNTNDIIDWLKVNTDFKVGNMKVAIGLENDTKKLVNIKQPYNSDKVTVLQKTVVYGVGKGHNFVVPSLTIESTNGNHTLKVYGVEVLKDTTLEDIKDYIEGSQYYKSEFKNDPLQWEYRG
ncbi:hypothetical protein [Mammaliicoccus phage vB_MscM-PMS3]|nr:hypothetical protein [Mammaliicoccus phage vB_MscM-PMS3]